MNDNDCESCDRNAFVLSLINTAIETNGGFNVFPPDVIRKDASVMVADDVVERLHETTWRISFRNGRQESLSFVELILLLFNLKQLQPQIEAHERRSRRTGKTGTVRLNTTFDEDLILQTSVVHSLFRDLIQGQVRPRKSVRDN